MTFTSFEDVDAWVAAKGPNGAEKLRGRLEAGQMAGPRATWAQAWLKRHDRQIAGEAQTKEQELTERATIAAEISADAARRSAIWAKYSGAIALAALVFSVLAFMKSCTP
jgi:hypothetical protein